MLNILLITNVAYRYFLFRYGYAYDQYTAEFYIKFGFPNQPTAINSTLELMRSLAWRGDLDDESLTDILNAIKDQWQISDSAESFLDDHVIPELQQRLSSSVGNDTRGKTTFVCV